MDEQDHQDIDKEFVIEATMSELRAQPPKSKVQEIRRLWMEKRDEEGVLASERWYEMDAKPLAVAWRGRFLQRLRRNDEALLLFDQASRAGIGEPWFHISYVKALSLRGRDEDAAEYLASAIQKGKPESNGHLYDMQEGVNRRLGRWDSAKESDRLALKWRMDYQPFGRASILQKLISSLGVHLYLEIGVNDGSTFLKLDAPKKIAVDPFFKIPGGFENTDQEQWFQLTSDEFFLAQGGWLQTNPPDLVFIDGLHTYAQSLADVYNALKYLRPGGVIVMHDCLPTSEAAAAPTTDRARELRGLAGKGGAGGAWMGDVYRTILRLRSFNAELEVCVLDSDCGLGFVWPGKPESMLSLSEDQVRALSYHDLVKNKESLLNLKTTDWFDSFLAGLRRLDA